MTWNLHVSFENMCHFRSEICDQICILKWDIIKIIQIEWADCQVFTKEQLVNLSHSLTQGILWFNKDTGTALVERGQNMKLRYFQIVKIERFAITDSFLLQILRNSVSNLNKERIVTPPAEFSITLRNYYLYWSIIIIMI